MRVTKPGGKALFSTYSEKFWPDRLDWFRLQATQGLLGEIDEEKTRDGNIICKDGFTATTFSAAELKSLAESFRLPFTITEVDCSSRFLILTNSSQ